MKWPWKKKKLSFDEVVRFNWEMDTNAELRKKLDELAEQYANLGEKEYRRKLLLLFRENSLVMDANQLDMLLLLRHKTDQMLLRKEANHDEETLVRDPARTEIAFTFTTDEFVEYLKNHEGD